MTNGFILFVDNQPIFSPISQVNYEYYADRTSLLSSLWVNGEIQCIVGDDHIPFGQAHSPTLFDYADRVDAMAFLNSF